MYPSVGDQEFVEKKRLDDVKLLGKYVWKLILISVLSYCKAQYDVDLKVLEKHVGTLIFILTRP